MKYSTKKYLPWVVLGVGIALLVFLSLTIPSAEYIWSDLRKIMGKVFSHVLGGFLGVLLIFLPPVFGIATRKEANIIVDHTVWHGAFSLLGSMIMAIVWPLAVVWVVAHNYQLSMFFAALTFQSGNRTVFETPPVLWGVWAAATFFLLYWFMGD